MLQIPEIGFSHSVTKSNVNVHALADWLEAVILFDEHEITKSDVVDILVEYQICKDADQDLAYDIASEGWRELRLRQLWGGLPDTFHIQKDRIFDETRWQDEPIRSLFLLISLLKWYPIWANVNRDYVRQGNLFEEVVEEICPILLPGWQSYRAGWSPDNTKSVPAIVAELCERLFVQGAADLEEWVEPEAKDKGLDIVCYRAFQDQREALPVFFLQCASGKNWRYKVETPNPDVWQKLLNSAVKPSTGIVAPFVIDNSELKRAALTGQIIVFDRLRLLSVTYRENLQLSVNLRDEALEWMQPRVDSLPFLNI